ncbi:MAG: hypothetical protein AAFV86_18625 [Pseudomonadota bacterium]
MLWLVDLDRTVAEGRMTAETADLLKGRARRDATALAISVLQVGGTVTVLAGLFALIEGPAGVIVLGLAITLAALAALMGLDERYRLPGEAGGVIGVASTLGGVFWFANEEVGNTWPAILLGLAVMLGGLLLRRSGPAALTRMGAWTAALGGAAHLAGVFGQEGTPDLAWIALLDAAVVLGALGLVLDFRLLTALAIPAVAGIVSSTGYGHGSYYLAVYEATLTVIVMATVAGGAVLAAPRWPERWARHARIAGLLAFVWANIALWVGSLWGDVVGETLFGPRRAGFETGTGVDWEGYRAARAVFRESALTIPAEAFALFWAAVILAVGVWAALGGRRSVLNAAITFGAIHFYTQWFEFFSDAPGALIVAGVVAIALAWGTHRLNAMLRARAGEIEG